MVRMLLNNSFDGKWSSGTKWNSTTIPSSEEPLQRLLLLGRILFNTMASASFKLQQRRSVHTQAAILTLEHDLRQTKLPLPATMQSQRRRMTLGPAWLLLSSDRIDQAIDRVLWGLRNEGASSIAATSLLRCAVTILGQVCVLENGSRSALDSTRLIQLSGQSSC